MDMILFVVIGVVVALAYNKHKKKSEVELKETIREEINDAIKQFEEKHKLAEKDIDDLEYTLRKEIEENGK